MKSSITPEYQLNRKMRDCVSKFELISQLCSWKVPFVTMFEFQNWDEILIWLVLYQHVQCQIVLQCQNDVTRTHSRFYEECSSVPCLCFQYPIYCGNMRKVLQHYFQVYCKSSNKFCRLIDQSFPKLKSYLHSLK